MTKEKRFRVALSFPGEHRAFIERVAKRLAERLGRDRVLYDAYYEAEFARPDLDTHLQGLYHDESDLIVLFLSKNYADKEWCGLELRAVRDVIKQRRGATVMPARFDNTEIPGLFSTDGYLWIGERQPEDIAERILERLDLLDRSLSPGSGAATSDQRIAPSKLPPAPDALFGRDRRLDALDEAWNAPETHVVTVVAWGGVGKSSLVGSWVARLAGRDFDGADYFDWSFYSQGSREQSAVSSDPFFDAALRFFGDSETAESTRSPWDKGSRLAELVASRRTLLVLDGLEPLQYPPGPLRGELKDDGLRALLRGLAARNPGLCVVTTRESVEDLSNFRSETAPEWKLEHLSTEAGVSLLQALGVDGSQDDLESLVEDVRGHALTLNLLGRFLRDAYDGDVRQRDRIDFREADDETHGGHAFRVMEAYERWLDPPRSISRRFLEFVGLRKDENLEGRQQLAILRLLGLFDRPADAGCLDALRRPPAIAGLTEPIVSLRDATWNLSVRRLEDAGLLLREDDGHDALDAHPLVREHFARRLEEEHPEAYKEAHGRLFDHLKDTTEHQPDTLDGLQPLYQAVMHGCRAGRHQEACDDVYIVRILRGLQSDGYYSVRKLGAFGAELGAVACFFGEPWSHVSSSLTEVDQAWLFDQAAFRLRALGRLREAVEPMRAGLVLGIEQTDWKNAAIRASNLSQLELTLGDIDAAVRDAEQSVDFADRSEDAFQRMGKRTTLADALHQAGRRNEARERFREAEAMNTDYQPRYPQLYSVQGYLYCDLLLADAERAAAGVDRDEQSVHEDLRDVERRAESVFEWRQLPAWNHAKDPVLDIALDHLTLGRSRLYRALLDGTDADAADSEIGKAVDGLRRSGATHHLPRGLLTRAWLRFAQDRPDDARTDLDEAEEIARRGPMPLHLADIALYRARFFDDPDALAEARRLIDKHGYERRREEFGALEARGPSESTPSVTPTG